MSDLNSPTPDPSDAVPGYTPPTTPEPAAPSAEPPAYTPPAVPGGYEPPAPPAYTPPPTGGYEPPAPGAYSAPAAGGFTPPPPPAASFPEPAGFPPQGAYNQPGYGAPNLPLAPTGGGLADWPKRALGGLIDYVAPGIVFSILSQILANVSSGLASTVSFVLGVGWMVYLGYKSGTTGVTFGRSITKTKLISEATGQPIGVGNGIVRQLAHIIDSIICYIGWLFPLWDVKKQTIADKLMKTVVIDNSADPNASTYSWT
jgi:uncharacterized RDD family membrane protein YckC